MAVSFVNCGIIEDAVEAGAYALLRQSILESGKSVEFADCIEKVLKWQGAGKDMKENMFNPDRLMEHLKTELNTADFLCENRIVLSVVAFVLAILFILCICGCCRR